MPEDISYLTPPSIISEMERILDQSGYVVRREQQDISLPKGRSLLAEDGFGVLLIIVYESWQDLSSDWHSVHAMLVDLLSSKLARTDPKVWEGYLMLIYPLSVGEEAKREAEQIRHDVSRIRKLVVTGDDLRSLSDIERVLLPLLPLNIMQSEAKPVEVLDFLPVLLSRYGIEENDARIIVEAYKRQEPLLERLYRYQEGQ